uniref:PiggyBac transposable element-derived protein domain-containing protein n=1 Tax=Amphilophus citrinellus TaxID=61819 RepID=A0A3Q0SG42_AMPCI
DQEQDLQSYTPLCSFSPPAIPPKPHPHRDSVCSQTPKRKKEKKITARKNLNFFSHLFTQEMINNIVFYTNLYVVQKVNENLGLTSEEFKTFLGKNTVMSYIRYPRARMYWSSEQGLCLDLVANAMPVNRFEKIMRYVHFLDNYSIDPKNADRFVKIRPFLNALQGTFSVSLDPEEYQSVDEMMIPFKGCLSIKQYVPKNFEPNQDVMMRLCEDLQDRNHMVFFDNFFCAIPPGFEASRLKTEKQLKKEGRGSVSVVTCAQNITITRWMDSSVIHMASSCTGKEKKMLKVQRPFAVKLYNQHMGGVNQMDQMVAAHPHRRRNKRWYIRVFFHFVDIAVVNAWLLYRMSGNEAKDLLHFKASTARALINAGSVTIPSRCRPSTIPPPVNTKYTCLQCVVFVCPDCSSLIHHPSGVHYQ